MAEFSFDKLLEYDRLADILHAEVMAGKEVDRDLIGALRSYQDWRGNRMRLS
jgi:hypothetical protein